MVNHILQYKGLQQRSSQDIHTSNYFGGIDMTTDEKTLLEIIRNSDDPGRALLIALDVMALFLAGEEEESILAAIRAKYYTAPGNA